MTELRGKLCRLRSFRRGDEDDLVRHADDHDVWRNLKDRFPHPYTREDAEEWVSRRLDDGEPTRTFAIEVDGEVVGGIGLETRGDIYRLTAELGYWLGQAHWGRGIVTEAVGLITGYAFDVLDLIRVQAGVYEWNPASARVLEKNGYVREGRLRKAVIKEGRVGDLLLYARIREDSKATGGDSDGQSATATGRILW